MVKLVDSSGLSIRNFKICSFGLILHRMSKTTLTRKQEICITAARLFKQKGYSAVTMRDIAAKVGIKAASLYNHISSKEEILNEVILVIAHEFTSGIEEIRFSNQDVSVKLEAVVSQHVHLTMTHPYGMASLNNDWMHLGKGTQRYLDLRDTYEMHFRAILIEGKKAGGLKDIDEEVILFFILGSLRNLYQWVPKKNNLDKDKLITSLCQTLLRGIEI